MQPEKITDIIFLGCGATSKAIIEKIIRSKFRDKIQNYLKPVDYSVNIDNFKPRKIHIFSKKLSVLNNDQKLKQTLSFMDDNYIFNNIKKFISSEDFFNYLAFNTDCFYELINKIINQKHANILIIQATSLPHQNISMLEFKKACEKALVVNINKNSADRIFIMDLCYNPCSELKDIKKIKFISGVDMLIYQALLSQRLWWQKACQFEQIKPIVIKKLSYNLAKK